MVPFAKGSGLPSEGRRVPPEGRFKTLMSACPLGTIAFPEKRSAAQDITYERNPVIEIVPGLSLDRIPC
jgi:hypothetical protein